MELLQFFLNITCFFLDVPTKESTKGRKKRNNKGKIAKEQNERKDDKCMNTRNQCRQLAYTAGKLVH
jgi:hypothetical protein